MNKTQANRYPTLIGNTLNATKLLKWCHWKSNCRLSESMLGICDFDLYISPDDYTKFASCIKALPFVEVLSLPWNTYKGVFNFIGFDKDSGKLYHFHLHDNLLTGLKSAKQQKLPWESILLSNLTTDDIYSIPIPSPELELNILLAREASKITLPALFINSIKKKSDELLKSEATYLLSKCDKKKLSEMCTLLWKEQSSDINIFLSNAENFTRRQIYSSKKLLLRELNPYSSSILYAYCKLFYGVIQKKMFLCLNFFGFNLSVKMPLVSSGCLIAFIGSDGSGKTTVTNSIYKWLSWKMQAKIRYLGAKNKLFNTIASPLKSRNPSKHFNTRSTRQKSGFIFQLRKLIRITYSLILKHVNINGIHRSLSSGHIILLDRFPQSEVNDISDGMYTLPPPNSNPLLLMPFHLVKKYQKYVFGLVNQIKPDLLIRLDVDLETAINRKPDHDFRLIERKIKLVSMLKYENIDSVTIATNRSLEETLLDIKRLIWTKILNKQNS